MRRNTETPIQKNVTCFRVYGNVHRDCAKFLFLRDFYIFSENMPGLDPDETLIAEERLFPPIPSIDATVTSQTSNQPSAMAPKD